MSQANVFTKLGYVSAPLANAIGRFLPQCQRMTIKFCKNHGGSQGVREFIEMDIVEFARCNPATVVYLKPRRHRSAVVIAEYLNGEREWMSLHNYSRDEVRKWLEVLRTSGGVGPMQYQSYHRTDTPSIQGVWTPFTHKSFEHNLMKFPNEKLNVPANTSRSATEIILEMYGDNKSEEKTSNQ